MIKKLIIAEIISIGLLISGVALLFHDNWIIQQIGSVSAYFGLVCMIISPIIYHITISKKTNTIVIYSIIFLVLNIVRHFVIIYMIIDLKEFFSDLRFSGISVLSFTIRYLCWLGITSFLIGYLISILKQKPSFDALLQNKKFKLLVILILLLILLEAPLYNFHSGFGGREYTDTLFGIGGIFTNLIAIKTYANVKFRRLS